MPCLDRERQAVPDVTHLDATADELVSLLQTRAFTGPAPRPCASHQARTRFAARVLARAAWNERDRIRERIRDVKRHLAAQGIYAGGLSAGM